MGRATFLYFVVIFPCLPVPGMLEFRLESHSNIIGVYQVFGRRRLSSNSVKDEETN